jgi:hypothetical protein
MADIDLTQADPSSEKKWQIGSNSFVIFDDLLTSHP